MIGLLVVTHPVAGALVWTLLFDFVLDVLGKACAGCVADFDARNGVTKGVVAAHELVKAELSAGRLIDEHVDVGKMQAGIAKQ